MLLALVLLALVLISTDTRLLWRCFACRAEITFLHLLKNTPYS